MNPKSLDNIGVKQPKPICIGISDPSLVIPDVLDPLFSTSEE